ncbi:hypothetical protein D3C81_1317490 [compost metagenome]
MISRMIASGRLKYGVQMVSCCWALAISSQITRFSGLFLPTPSSGLTDKPVLSVVPCVVSYAACLRRLRRSPMSLRRLRVVGRFGRSRRCTALEATRPCCTRCCIESASSRLCST